MDAIKISLILSYLIRQLDILINKSKVYAEFKESVKEYDRLCEHIESNFLKRNSLIIQHRLLKIVSA